MKGSTLVFAQCVDSGRGRLIDTMKDCLKKRGLGVRQARRMVHDRNEWRGLGGGMNGG